MSRFSRLSPSLTRICNNSALDPLIPPWVYSISGELGGWRWFLVCVGLAWLGLACSSWPWLDPTSLLAPHLLNISVSHITVRTSFQLSPGCLLVVLWNVAARHPCMALGMLEVGKPYLISFLFHLFLFFSLFVYSSVYLSPISVTSPSF